jgi:dihydroxyacid dehydratase/phosphogluconate dehydratase
MNTDTRHPDLETRIALRHGAHALQYMRESLERAAKDIANCEAQFLASDNLSRKAKILNAAIIRMCTGVINNARIDLAADAQAELHAIAEREDAA